MRIVIDNQNAAHTGSLAVHSAFPFSHIDGVAIFIAANQCEVHICAANAVICLPCTVYKIERATWMLA
jgi:hypothetical protein